MADLFGAETVLFESEEGGESLRIECAATEEGGLALMQESDGPLTRWCFEESPHRIETEVAADGACGLLEYFHLDDAEQLPAVLRMQYVGYDCGQRIRALMRRLEIPYRVIENVVER